MVVSGNHDGIKVMQMARIEDFGEKIGGAKKDLFGTKGTVTDFSNMESWNKQQRNDLITKDNVFPKPDYRKLYESGIPKEVCWFIKKVRDSITSAPKLWNTPESKKIWSKIETAERHIKIGGVLAEKAQESLSDLMQQYHEECEKLVLQRQQEYVQQVGLIRDLCKDLQTTDDVLLFEDHAERAGLSYSPVSQGMNKKTKEVVHLVPNGILDYHYAYSYSMWQSMVNRMEDEQFLMTKAEKQADLDFLIARYNGNNVMATSEKGLLVIFEHGIVCDAEHEIYAEAEELAENPVFNIDNYQEGKYFAFDRENQRMIGINFDTFEEARKAAVTAIENRQTLSAKTKSSKEKLKPVYLESIQRTGEDYREGTDITGLDMLEAFELRGGEFGNSETQTERQINLNQSYDAFKDLAKILSVEERDISLGGQLAIAFGSRGHGNALAHYERTANVINLTRMKGAGSLGHEWGHALDAYVAKTLQTGTTFGTKSADSPFSEVIQAMIKNPDGSKTKYLSDAEFLGNRFSNSGNQTKCYWNSEVEMFARAFSCYLLDKLKESGEQNDYLCGHAEKVAVKFRDVMIYAYPVGEERERINQAIDNMIENLKERGILHHQEHTAAKQKINIEIDSSGTETEKPALQQNPEILAEFDRIMDMVNEYFPDLEYYPDFEACESKEEVPDYVESALLDSLNQQKGTSYYLQYGFEGNVILKGFEKFVAYTDDLKLMLAELKDDVSKEERKLVRNQKKETKIAAER